MLFLAALNAVRQNIPNTRARDHRVCIYPYDTASRLCCTEREEILYIGVYIRVHANRSGVSGRDNRS